MKRAILPTILLAFAASVSLAQVTQFEDVDINEDGALSIVEFQAAVPTLVVTDSNADGMLNQKEIEAIVPELDFAEEGFQGGMALVGKDEYEYMIEVLLDAGS